jgi:hypothetical protein
VFARRCYQGTRCTQLGGVVGYQGRHRVKRGCGSSCTAGIGSPAALCPSPKWASSLFCSTVGTPAVDAGTGPSRSGIWEFVTAPGGGQVTLTGFDAAGGQRKSLPPMCGVGSHPQRAIRHPLYDSAGSLRCWHSSTARPRLKLCVRIHSAVVGQRSECSHAAAIRELAMHTTGGRCRLPRTPSCKKGLRLFVHCWHRISLLPSAPLRNGLHHFFARRSEHLRSTLALLPLARGILGFVTAPGGGQVTDWIRCRWWPAKISLTCVLGWLSTTASLPTSAVRLRWLTPLAQQHRSPAFETPRENSLRCRRSEQRGFARRCYQGTRCTQLGGVGVVVSTPSV